MTHANYFPSSHTLFRSPITHEEVKVFFSYYFIKERVRKEETIVIHRSRINHIIFEDRYQHGNLKGFRSDLHRPLADANLLTKMDILEYTDDLMFENELTSSKCLINPDNKRIAGSVINFTNLQLTIKCRKKENYGSVLLRANPHQQIKAWYQYYYQQ